MKKLLLTCILALGIGASAQVGPPQASATNTLNGYGFAQSSGTYTPLSATRTVWQSGATLGTDLVSGAVPLPTPFKYNGKSYSSIYISNNGFITFAAPSLPTTYTALSTNGASAANLFEGAIAGFAVNLRNANTTTSEIAYETVGSKFIVQFTDVQGNAAAAAQLINFQIQLDSSNNTVAIVYGTCVSGTANLTGQVGLKGGESSDMNNRTGTNWTTTAIGTSTTSSCTLGTTNATTVPASGLTFNYTPGTWLASPTTPATLPFTEAFSTWANGNSTLDVPNATYWRTWPSRGDNSWRPSDISTSGFTSASGWTSITGAPAIAIPAVAPAARFHSYDTTSNSYGYMDLYVDLSTGGAGDRVVAFDYINSAGTDKLDVLLSTDGGTTFTSMGSSLGVQAAWANKSFTTSSTANNAIIRFLATGDFGSSPADILMDNLSIVVSAVPPPCTTIATPAAAATSVSVTPTITWASATGATSYILRIGTTAGGFDVINNVDVGNITSYTIPAASALTFGTQYFVTVFPNNSFGTATGCTESTFTTTTTVPCPVVSAPASAATGVSLTPTFTWAAVGGATGYRITIGTTSGGTDILNAQDVANVTSWNYSGPALNNATVYFYKIDAYSGTFNSATCTIRSFTTLCAVLPAPYTMNFSGGTLPTCWSNFSTNNTSNALWKFDAATQDYGTTFNAAGQNRTAGTFAYVDASSPYAGVKDVTLLTPQIDLTGLTAPMVKFSWYKNHSSTGTLPATLPTLYSNNRMTVSVRDIATSTWDAIFADDSNLSTWRTQSITLPASYIGKTIEVRFVVDKDVVAGQGYFYDNLLLDDVIVAETPVCVEPSAVVSSNVDLTSATISWTAPATAPGIGYDVYYSTSNTAPTAATTPTTTTTSTTTTVNVSSLTQSTTYFVWVRSNCTATEQSTWTAMPSFTTLTPPPANDNCSTPTTINPGAIFSQNALTGTNVAATDTTDTTATTACQTTRSKDVWYSVVVPASGSLTIETDAVTGSAVTDTVLGVYSGSCGTLTQVGCDDDTGNGNFSRVVLTGQAPGSTLLVAVYNYSSSTTGTFQVSAFDGSLATSNIVREENGVNIYPNPFSDFIRISDVKDVVSVSIVDMAGRVVKTVKPASEINLSSLKSGMYLINLTMKDGSVKTVKSIKK